MDTKMIIKKEKDEDRDKFKSCQFEKSLKKEIVNFQLRNEPEKKYHINNPSQTIYPNVLPTKKDILIEPQNWFQNHIETYPESKIYPKQEEIYFNYGVNSYDLAGTDASPFRTETLNCNPFKKYFDCNDNIEDGQSLSWWAVC